MSDTFADFLPDFMPQALVVLSIGINPSPHAVHSGYPFAFARNRFWPALNGSRLLAEPLLPGRAAMAVLGARYGFGFTDVVKRATPGMKNLKAADYDRDAPLLLAKIRCHLPAVLWFHGKVAAREFLTRVTKQRAELPWGEQAQCVAGARVYISPNPSPANASYSVTDLIASYDGLAALRARLGV